MALKREAPLLPVHSVRHPQKRMRRKATLMRVVILVTILFGVGYAAFAARYIGTSKHRKDLQDTLIRTQLERKSNGAGAQHEGRALKAEDGAAKPHEAHAHTSRDGNLTGTGASASPSPSPADIRSVSSPARHPHLHQLPQHQPVVRPPPVLSGSHHRGQQGLHSSQQHPQQQHPQQHPQPPSDSQEPGAPLTAPITSPITAPITAPVIAPITAPRIAPHHKSTREGRHHVYDANAQQTHEHPQHHEEHPQLSHVPAERPHAAPVIAGPVEADRAAETRTVQAPSLAVGSRIEADSRTSSPVVQAPSLAVGSLIEADSHTTDRAAELVEPGGVSRVLHAVTEPTAEAPVRLAAPITVTHVEPDSRETQQAQQQQLREPLLAAPIETDSSSQGAKVQAPDESRLLRVRVEAENAAPRGAGEEEVHAPVRAPVIRAPHEDTAPQRKPAAQGMYTLQAVDIDGRTRSLSEFAGKVTLVVNVASACGFTDENYRGLVKTYEKYRHHGLEILGFPCNQFGAQESGSEADIKSFCSAKYHVDFPMFSKVDVNGPGTHPVYQFLKRELPEAEGGGGGKGPGKDLIWNFQKILVNHEGRPVKLFYQSWDQGAVEQAIYRLLHEARTAGALGAASQ